MTKKWYFFLFTTGAALVFVWCWRVMIYEPLQTQEELKVTAIAGLEQKKAQIPDVRYHVDLIKHHNDQIRRKLQLKLLNHEHIDPYVTLEHVLLNIDEIGLHLVSLTPQEFKHKAFYEKCIFGFKALGTYEQIMLLFDHFCEKHTHSLFKKVKITAQEDKLLLDAVIALYMIDRDGL